MPDDNVESGAPENVGSLYLGALALVERLHRRLLDVVKDEFDRRGGSEISSAQALLLHTIGDSEPTAAELRAQGHYLGSNIAQNIKKLSELGYIDNSRRAGERTTRVALSGKGREIRDIVDALYAKHAETIEQLGGVSAEDFQSLNNSAKRIERFWTDQIRFRL